MFRYVPLIIKRITNNSNFLNLKKNFGEEVINVSKKGDILLKVQLHPFKQNQVKYRLDGNIIILEVTGEAVKETMKEVEPPPNAYHGGEKSFQTTKISTYSYEARMYKLPMDVNHNSIQTKFENGYFILTAHLND
uniref:SHSP domain-containing protein n=1 Tax=Clastoptera arizonana TaxID=38151 RepID=A0A1B6C0P1_9HEMI